MLRVCCSNNVEYNIGLDPFIYILLFVFPQIIIGPENPVRGLHTFQCGWSTFGGKIDHNGGVIGGDPTVDYPFTARPVGMTTRSAIGPTHNCRRFIVDTNPDFSQTLRMIRIVIISRQGGSPVAIDTLLPGDKSGRWSRLLEVLHDGGRRRRRRRRGPRHRIKEEDDDANGTEQQTGKIMWHLHRSKEKKIIIATLL